MKRKREGGGGGGGGRKTKKQTKEEKETELLTDAVVEVNKLKSNPETMHMEKYLRGIISSRFEDYINHSILNRVSDTIDGVITEQFEPKFTRMILSTATPHQGIMFSLQTYLSVIDSFANEILCIIASRYVYGKKLKQKTKIELRFEEEPIHTFLNYESTNILAQKDTTVNHSKSLLAFFHDQNSAYLSGYKDADKKLVNLYCAYINDSFLTSVIIPHTSHSYQLILNEGNNNNNNSNTSAPQLVMQERYKTNFIALKMCEAENEGLKKKLQESEGKIKKYDLYINGVLEKNTVLTQLNQSLQNELDEYDKKLNSPHDDV